MPARGRYSGRKKKKEKNNPRSRGRTTGTHNSNEAIYPPTYSSTAVRSTTVTPTKRSTHHPCIAAVQQMTYSSSRCVQFERSAPSSRESGETTMGPENKVRNTSNTHTHEHTRSSTHPLTHRPNHPPTHQPTHPRHATAIQWSTSADTLIQTELQ